MAWDVRLSDEAIAAFKGLPGKTANQVGRAIDALAEDPFRGDVKSLKGKEWEGRFRKRSGDYRIIFRLNHEKKRVLISAIMRRSETTYR